jgi:hypothetical protein
MANAYNVKGDAHIRSSLKRLATPHTYFPNTVAVSHIQSDGSSKPFTTTEHNFAHDHLEQFGNIRAYHTGNGVAFIGKRKGINAETGRPHDKEERVALMQLKGGNGPYEGANSTLVFRNIIKDTSARKAANSKLTKSPAPSSAESKEVSSIKTKAKTPTPVAPTKSSVTSAAAKVMSKTKTNPVQSKPTQVIAQPKVQNKPESAYDYKGARSQDLGRKSRSGDTEAEKEIKRREQRK